MIEVTADQQAMWDALEELGFDCDEALTPREVIAGMGPVGFRRYFAECIAEVRADYDSRTVFYRGR